MIELHDVSKKYGPKTALHPLSLTIPAGELFAFVGPNGAGKTTTIKLVCGLLFPTTGTVRVGGFDMQKEGDQARQVIAYVPDMPFLYEKLTGREFLQFIGDMYRLDRDHCRERLDAVIDLFSLHEFVDDLTERYSHGMRQRTVFAAALLHEPKVLIVDEPTVGLDPRSIRHLKDLLRKQADAGTTVFLSSHSLDIVEQLADRIGIIDHGKLIGCGTLQSLRSLASMHGSSLEDVFLKLTQEAARETAAGPIHDQNPLAPGSESTDPVSTAALDHVRERGTRPGDDGSPPPRDHLPERGPDLGDRPGH